MRRVLVVPSMFLLACFGEAPEGATAEVTGTSSTTATATSSADSSTTSTVETSAQTSSTVDTSDDDSPTTGADCEMGTVPTPPRPQGMWGGPGYMIEGDEPPTVCPAPLGTGPRGLVGSIAELGNECQCRCEGELLDVCDFSFAAGVNCTSGLTEGGVFAMPCVDLPGPQNAVDVVNATTGCSPVASPPPAPEVQLCPGEDVMAECFPLRPDMRGPCFWSPGGGECPPDLETIVVHEASCNECPPCDHAEYCDDREWTAYDAFGCDGNVVAQATDDNCHLGFSSPALSVEVAPAGPPPLCEPSGLVLQELTICCA